MKRHKTVGEFLKDSAPWKKELTRLREILLGTGLEETVKWGAPCYCSGGKNLVGIGGFKSYFGLWFFQGALLADKRKVLVAGGEKTRAMRQLRLTSLQDIDENLIRIYVQEAIQLSTQGVVIQARKDLPLEIPPELGVALEKNKKARAIFEKMSKCCRREYSEYIATAKQEATKQRRLEKILPMIEAGGGLHDKYRSC